MQANAKITVKDLDFLSVVLLVLTDLNAKHEKAWEKNT